MIERKGASWNSDEEEKLRQEFECGYKISELAEIHGRSSGAIKSRLRVLGLITQKPMETSRVDRGNRSKAFQEYYPGMQYMAISQIERYARTPHFAYKCTDQYSQSFVDSIRNELLGIELSEQSSGDSLYGTKQIAKAIIEFATRNKYMYFIEVKTSIERKNSNRKGRIDYVIFTEKAKFAIEVDSSNKRWSLEKLKCMAEKGYIAIWIKWRIPTTLSVPASVLLVELAQ